MAISGLPPSGVANKDKAQQDREQAQQAREKEAEAWRQIDAAVMFARRRDWAAWPRWRKISGPPDDEPKKDDATFRTLASKQYKDGVYKLVTDSRDKDVKKEKFNILVKDGAVRIIPPPTDAESPQAYGRALDFLGAQGMDTVHLEIPGVDPTGKNSGALSRDRLEIILKLAEERGMSVTFGDNLIAYMQTHYPAADYERFIKIQKELDKNVLINNMIADIGSQSTFESFKTKIEQDPNNLKNQFKTATDDTQRKNEFATSLDAATPAEQLKKIEDAQAKIEDSLATVKMALSELKSHQDSSKAFIDAPEKAQHQSVSELKSRFGRFKEWVGKMTEKRDAIFKEPEKMLKVIKEDRENGKESREELIGTLEKQITELETQREVTKQKLDVMPAAGLDQPNKDKRDNLIKQNDGFKEDLRSDATGNGKLKTALETIKTTDHDIDTNLLPTAQKNIQAEINQAAGITNLP